MVQFLVETIVSVLSSSISCKVLRFPKDEVLLIGSSIYHRDCAYLFEACSDVLGKLEVHGGFSSFNFPLNILVFHWTFCFIYSN